MPVRLRITFLFTLITVLLLAIVCGTTYYISYTNRVSNIQTRLENRAITTARLLGRSEMFDKQALRRIDSLTATALRQKTVQAYDASGRRVYFFSDSYADTIASTPVMLASVRQNVNRYFTLNNRDVVAMHITEGGEDLVLIAAAFDEIGRANLNELVTVLLISSIIGLIIAILSGYVFSRRLLSPVTRITKQVDEISAKNLTNRIPTGSVKDEWYHLTSTLNNLLNRLQQSFETQRRFVSNASHELSTPLTSISSQLQVYLQKDREPEEYKNVMHSIYQDVQRMNNLTRTLLEIAKTSGDAGGLELDAIRIDEILLKLPAELQKINPAYSVDLSFDDLPEEEHDLFVYGNEELLSTAFKNIAANSCKYAEDQQARITLSTGKDMVEIKVQDNGKGIPGEQIGNIFEPFFRSDNVKNTEGFGLGLSLALKIIKIHKGNIEVASEVGKGTLFTIHLPSSGKRNGYA